MFSNRLPPTTVDKTALVDAADAKTIDKEINTSENNGSGCGRKCGGGKCCNGKCCVGMALVGVPVAIVLSPIWVPTLLVRRAIYGPMKCGKRGDTEEKEKEKEATDEGDEKPKTDRA